jgi:hypothetical protein
MILSHGIFQQQEERHGQIIVLAENYEKIRPAKPNNCARFGRTVLSSQPALGNFSPDQRRNRSEVGVGPHFNLPRHASRQQHVSVISVGATGRGSIKRYGRAERSS